MKLISKNKRTKKKEKRKKNKELFNKTIKYLRLEVEVYNYSLIRLKLQKSLKRNLK